jgi:hypothetical protein
MPSTEAEASRKMLFGDQDDDFDTFLDSAVATPPSAAAASAPGTTAVVSSSPAPQATSSAAQQLDPLDDLFDEPKPAAGTPPRVAAANHALAAAGDLVHMDSISLDEPEPAPPPPPQQQPSARNALAALPSAPASSGVQTGAEPTQVTDSPAPPLQGHGAAAGRGAAKVVGMDVDADMEGGVGLETDNPFGLPRLTEAQRAVLQEEEGNGEGEAAEAGGALRKGQGPTGGGGGGADTGGGGGGEGDEQQPLSRPPRWMWLSASAMGDRAQAVAVEDAKVGVRYFLSGGRRAVVSSDGKLHISMGRTEPMRGGSPHGGGGGGVGGGGRYDGRYGPAASLLGR